MVGLSRGVESKLGEGVELSFEGGVAQVMSTWRRMFRWNIEVVPPGLR